MNQPFQTETANHKLGISIGVAFYPQDTEDPQELIDLADQAMYVGKKIRNVVRSARNLTP